MIRLAGASPPVVARAVGHDRRTVGRRVYAKLLRLLLSGTVAELVLTSKDRLLRFGSELVFFLCARLGVKVTILDPPTGKSREATFTQDVLAVLTVFSATLYGARAHRLKAPLLAA